MDIKMPKKPILLTYEETELGILIAMEASELAKINAYRKSQGKSSENTILAYPFLHCDIQNSLKIDFDQKNEYLIDNLAKFTD